MNAVLEELAKLQLYTPEQAAEIMSGDNVGMVTGWYLREGIRKGEFPYTPMGKRRMLSLAQIAKIIEIRAVAPTSHASRRKTAA